MVILKKSEIKYKKEGFEFARQEYSKKLNKQIEEYDKEINKLEKNLQKKLTLINDIEEIIKEYENSNKYDENIKKEIAIFREIKENFNGDKKIIEDKEGEVMLAKNNISLEVLSMKTNSLFK